MLPGSPWPSLPRDQWAATYDAAWSVAAAITVAYRSATPAAGRRSTDTGMATATSSPTLAVENRDEHVIKFVEVAAESHATRHRRRPRVRGASPPR